MLNYKKMFKPFEGDGCTFDMCVAWVKEKTEVDDTILELAVSQTMLKVAQGEKFEIPCQCGCGGELKNVHTPISHDMLIEAAKLKAEKEVMFSEFIERKQKVRIEAQLKQLVNNDKQMLEIEHGTWSDRNIPTLKRWSKKWL